MIERCKKGVQTRRKGRTRNIEISKYFHLISYIFVKFNQNKLLKLKKSIELQLDKSKELQLVKSIELQLEKSIELQLEKSIEL